MLKLRIASVALAAALFGGAASALAQEATPEATDETVVEEVLETEETTDETVETADEATEDTDESVDQSADTTQIAGAEGLVAAVVQVADTIDINDTNIEVVTVEIEESFNDNDIDVNVIRDVLNNSPILNENNVVITDVIDVSDVDVDPIIAIGVLQGGDIIIFTSGDQ